MPSEQTKCILYMLSESIKDLDSMHKDVEQTGHKVDDFISYKVQQKLEATLFLLNDEVYGPSITKLDEMEKEEQ